MTHIQSGSKLISEWYAEKTRRGLRGGEHVFEPTSYASWDKLTRLIRRLHVQTAIINNRPLVLDSIPEFRQTLITPLAFENLQQAKVTFDEIWHQVISLGSVRAFDDKGLTWSSRGALADRNAAYYTRRKQCTGSFGQWSRAFESFLQRSSEQQNGRAAEDVLLLQIQHTIASIVLDMDFVALVEFRGETLWDKYTAQAEKIIGLATHISQHEIRQPRNFKFLSLDVGLIWPLMCVSLACRHPSLRRQAIALVRLNRRQEGILDSDLVARILERVVEIEERGITALGFVPGWSRISDIQLHFQSDKSKVLLSYRKCKSQVDQDICLAQEWLST